MPRAVRDPIPVRKLLAAIRRLPPDRPVEHPRRWYLTQHEHWIGWLSHYHTPGAYGRDASVARDAKYAYNHIVEVDMLIYLARAAGVSRRRRSEAAQAAESGRTLMQRSAAFRRHIEWATVAKRLWPDYEPGPD